MLVGSQMYSYISMGVPMYSFMSQHKKRIPYVEMVMLENSFDIVRYDVCVLTLTWIFYEFIANFELVNISFII